MEGSKERELSCIFLFCILLSIIIVVDWARLDFLCIFIVIVDIIGVIVKHLLVVEVLLLYHVDGEV